MLLAVLDLAGIAVFAISGALAAVAARLDVFGVISLASLTALGGGVVRDLLLGITPPTSLQRWPYLLTPIVVGVIVFVVHPVVARLSRVIQWADAFGLALFATAGASTAVRAGAAPLAACVIGMLTAIGGGIIRDVLVGEVPYVLRREIYAVPALVGSGLVVAGHHLGLPETPTTIVAASLILVARLAALVRGWDAPRPRDRGSRTTEDGGAAEGGAEP